MGKQVVHVDKAYINSSSSTSPVVSESLSARPLSSPRQALNQRHQVEDFDRAAPTHGQASLPQEQHGKERRDESSPASSSSSSASNERFSPAQQTHSLHAYNIHHPATHRYGYGDDGYGDDDSNDGNPYAGRGSRYQPSEVHNYSHGFELFDPEEIDQSIQLDDILHHDFR